MVRKVNISINQKTTIALEDRNREWLVGLKRGRDTYDDVIDRLRLAIEHHKIKNV